MAVFSMAGGNPALPTYPLQRSVRLRSSASAYFNRTPASAGNRRTWTLSFWFKRGTLGVLQSVFVCGPSTGLTDTNYFGCGFNSTDTFGIGGGATSWRVSNAVFRDPSAWYHIVIAVDTTQATGANRIRAYVNGVELTWGTSSDPTLNADLGINQNISHSLGSSQPALTRYVDGYLTEVNFIDGQALTPSSFGAYNSYGVWSPAKYTGTYGTNGFYLNFQDNSALTTTANVGIGKDSSGNGNYWTSNNISITAGTTYDSMLDVPTLTSNTNSNYCTLNPLKNGALTVTNGNLTVTGTAATTGTVVASMGVTSGKWYWEYTVGSTDQNSMIGICTDAVTLTSYIGFDAYGWGYYGVNGNKYNNSTPLAYGASYTNGDIIGVALDADSGTLTFYKNNTSQGTAYTGLTSGPYFPAFGDSGSAATPTGSFNFGQRPFTYTPPTGYNRLCTYNLPDSIVPVGAQYMAATTYTGNGVATPNALVVTNTVNGKSFQPDFVWVKSRSLAQGHVLEDSVRGTSVFLQTDTTAADLATGGGDISSFNSNGFTLSYGNARTNQNAATYVGWQWRASNASAVTNTNGALTSQVSVNQSAGFSIVTWTGNGTGGTTVGHGLSALPQFVIIKKRSTTGDWYVASYAAQGLNYAYHLFLNTTGALSGSNDPYYMGTQTSLTSNVLQLAAGNPNNGGNENGTTYVAYCWTPVPGFSKFGSYTGNGSTDGPFVFTNFRPRWIMAKRTDTTGDWVIWDTSRNTYNVAENGLYPNLSVAEGNSYFIDVLSNGFKLRMSTIMNVNSGTYIYAAFSENPFKNSLAR